MCFLEMSHLIPSLYNRLCIDLTMCGFLVTFFQYKVAHFKILSGGLSLLNDFQNLFILYKFIVIKISYTSNIIIPSNLPYPHITLFNPDS